MTVDVTGISTAVIAGVFSVLAVVVPMILSKYMGDKQAATVLSNAIDNALGAIQQAIVTGKTVEPPIPGIRPELAIGVQYVEDHAGAEAHRFKLTPALIADKLDAKIGLHTLAMAQATPPAATPFGLPRH